MAVITYKCPKCGADLKYSPESGKYRCEYCDSEFTQEELGKQAEVASSTDQKSDAAQTQTGSAVIYTCPSCGAELVTDSTTAATTCFYCHNPVILTGRLEGEYLPKHIVPFEIGQEEAKQKFIKWVSSKRFIPKDFSSPKQIEKMAGVYFPYWIVDEDVDVDADATGVRVNVIRAGDIETTETSYYQIERKGKIHFEDLSRNALKKADHKLVEGVMPYHTKDMKEFSMGYLSGFLAEKRDMEQNEVQQDIDDEMRKYSDIIIKESIPESYSSLEFHTLNLTPLHSEWEYALLPVWTVTYRQRGKDKIYYFAMNGQTGKVCGELPLDRFRLALLFLGVALPVLCLCLLGGWLL